jgi:hypothetical protein
VGAGRRDQIVNAAGDLSRPNTENREGRGSVSAPMAKNRRMLLGLAAPLSNRPITEIALPDVLAVLERVERCSSVSTKVDGVNRMQAPRRDR